MFGNKMKDLLWAEVSKMCEMQKAGDIEWFIPVDKFEGEYRQLASNVNDIAKVLIDNTFKVLGVVGSYGEGDLSAVLEDLPGKQKIANEKINLLKNNLLGLVADTDVLSKAAVEGKLATRADASKHKGDFRKIVQGVNDTLDAIVQPLNVSAEYVDRISKGDTPQLITDEYKGDFNEIKNNLNQCIGTLNTLVDETGLIIKAAVEGRLANRADTEKVQGVYKKILRGFNDTLDAVIGPLNVSAEYVDRISKGDIPSKITDAYNGDFNEIKNNLNQLIEVANNLLKETDVLVAASNEGKLDTRGNADQFAGGWRDLYKGINAMLDAILLPIGEGNRILGQISNGKIDELISQTYKGDHEKMKQAVNAVATVLQGLQKELQRLTEASKEGMLSERGKPEQFKGAYAEVIQGVNAMLDAILLPIGEGNRVLELIRGGNLKEKVDIACKGDHEKMKNAINGVHGWLSALIAYVTKIANGDLANAAMDKASADDQIHEWLMLLKANINALVTDANMLSVAAVEGKLATRADASKHQGDYKKIVEGFNKTLDAVIGPLNVAAEYVDRISKGDIPAKITDSYNGDFNEIKNNLNNCIEAIENQADAARRIGAGDLSVKINVRSEKDVLSKGLVDVVTVLTGLQKELQRLTEASKEGMLSERGKPEQFKGAYAEVIQGVNAMLDAILLPIGEGNRILAQISNGKIDELIAQTYKGDHEKMKQAINTVATVLQGLQKELQRLTEASKEGMLSERGKPEQFQGAYAEVVRGVNAMLDAILIPIGEGNRILRLIRGGNLRESVEIACKGDHEQMKNAINGVHGWLSALIAYVTKIANGDLANAAMDKASADDQIHEWLMLMKSNINALVTDANMLSVAAVEGKLATRADASKHQGDYRKIVEGVNKTLDAVIGPLNVAAGYVEKISREHPAKITDNYNGDFNDDQEQHQHPHRKVMRGGSQYQDGGGQRILGQPADEL